MPPLRSPEVLAPGSLSEWEERRQSIRSHFVEFLGLPPAATSGIRQTAQLFGELELPWCHAKLFTQLTGSPDGTVQQVLLLFPKGREPVGPCPAAIVPFYHPDESCGHDLRTAFPHLSPRNNPDEALDDSFTIQYGRHLVQQGYIVACTEVYAFNVLPVETPGGSFSDSKQGGFSQFEQATERLLRECPGWTGMGKMVHDLRLATDLLLAQSEVDPERVLCIGHSLGGKIAFYATALDERIK